KARRAGRLDEDELRVGADLVETGRHARRKPSAAYRQDDQRTVEAFSQLLHQFQGDRGLTLDDIRMIEGRHHDRRRGGSENLRGPVAIVEEVAHEPDFDILAAE